MMKLLGKISDKVPAFLQSYLIFRDTALVFSTCNTKAATALLPVVAVPHVWGRQVCTHILHRLGE
jgi:hypothetical protein